MTKSFSKSELNMAVAWLREQFPNAFTNRTSAIMPLQLGVLDHILDFYDRLEFPPFSKRLLRAGLNYYTSSTHYLRAQTIGKPRVDVFGFVVEKVTENQQVYAQAKLAELGKTNKASTKPSPENVTHPPE